MSFSFKDQGLSGLPVRFFGALLSFEFTFSQPEVVTQEADPKHRENRKTTFQKTANKQI